MSSDKSLARARRQLRSLDLPEQAGKILNYSRYWTEEFYLQLEDHCESLLFSDPVAGFQVARVLPTLARRIHQHLTQTSPRKLDDLKRRRLRELEARALCVLGGSYRRLGNLAKSEAVYRQALDIDTISLSEQANLCRRLAILRLNQGRIEEALTLVNGAIAIYRQEGNESFAKALMARGYIFLESGRYSEAVLDHAAALPYINAKKSPRAFHMAIHNICCALTKGSAYPEDLGSAIQYLREANRLTRTKRQSVPKLKLKWIQGILMNKLGFTRRGEMLLANARQGLASLGSPFDVAMVSLDLSALYLREGRIWKLSVLANETFQMFGELEDPETLAALRLWYHAAQAEVLTSEMISITRETLLSRQVAAQRRLAS